MYLLYNMYDIYCENGNEIYEIYGEIINNKWNKRVIIKYTGNCNYYTFSLYALNI